MSAGLIDFQSSSLRLAILFLGGGALFDLATAFSASASFSLASSVAAAMTSSLRIRPDQSDLAHGQNRLARRCIRLTESIFGTMPLSVRGDRDRGESYHLLRHLGCALAEPIRRGEKGDRGKTGQA